MKKLIVTTFIIIAFSTTSQACPPCRWLGEKWDSFVSYMEYVACRSQRVRYAQVTGSSIPPCEHKVNHDAPSK